MVYSTIGCNKKIVRIDYLAIHFGVLEAAVAEDDDTQNIPPSACWRGMFGSGSHSYAGIIRIR
jgi:hypothetical protein